jgi:hypothetical protein
LLKNIIATSNTIKATKINPRRDMTVHLQLIKDYCIILVGTKILMIG